MLRTRIWISALLCGLGLFLTGCVHSPVLAPNAAPKAGSVVLYGRFTIGRPNILDNQLALWLQNTDTRHNIYIFFDPRQPVAAVRVKPGRYRIAGFIGVNRAHVIEVRGDFLIDGKPLPFSRPFDAPAKASIYLGDFTGDVSYDGMVCEWQVDSITNNLVGTSAEFFKAYPKFSAIPPTSRRDVQAVSSDLPERLRRDLQP